MENLHLFTPVTEALPQAGRNILVIVTAYGQQNISLARIEVVDIGLQPPPWKVFYMDGLKQTDPEHKVTHWLDLSKLTDKKRASQKIQDAFDVAFSDNSKSDSQNFVNALKASL